ncbi:MAG: hypothetical protein IPK60_07225 [Sandaracinaceae bacterium]|jgi:uncharacterized membrane protein YkvA (DUF1232 family)|nr:hypothetical protein [Sandaracinaceae bacterium]
MPQAKFMEVVRDGLTSLPQDMKALMRVVEDPDIDDDSRIDAAGAILHLLSGQNAIPGLRGTIGYIDDIIVMLLVIERAHARSPEAMTKHEDESSSLFGRWKDNCAAMRAYLGDLVKVMERAADSVKTLSLQGHTANQCVQDVNSTDWLYESIIAELVRLDLSEAEISRAVKSVDQILPPLRQRAFVK